MSRHGKRLPTDATPTNYNITIQPDLINFTFEGEETIDITVCSTAKLFCNIFYVVVTTNCYF